jgi:hypothetical protein
VVVATAGNVGDVMEIKKPHVTGDRAPTLFELERWRGLLNQLDRSQRAHGRAFCLLSNVAIAAKFLSTRGIVLPYFSAAPGLEQQFLKVSAELEKITDMIRDVEDGTLGARWQGGDFDIIQPPSASGMQGFFIPVIVGLVLLVGVITRLIWVEKENNELSDKFNDILTKTDKTLCSDPSSQVCKDWKKTKSEKSYKENETLADTIKRAAASTGEGLGIGLMIAIPLLAWSWFGRKR